MNDERGSEIASPMSGRRSSPLIAAAGRTLAQLKKQADGVRAELLRLRQTVAEARREFSGTQVAQLRDANEQLVLSALQAETVADTAVNNLSELTRSSQRDALTDTPNRGLMLDRLESAIAFAQRHATRTALLFIDLDHFKGINDSLGHAVGDEVIKLAARQLQAAVRASDTVSRHGGDEFLVLLAEVADESSAARVARKVLRALDTTSIVGGHVVRLSASVGIAMYPEDGDDPETLIRRADAAMYYAKKCGRSRFALYSERSSSGSAQQSMDGSPQHSRASYDPDLAGHEPSLRNLRETNERLIISALAAQELGLQAQKAQHRQMELVATVARELRNPLSPLNPLRTVADLVKHLRTDEALSEHVQVIVKSQLVYMSRLVEELIDATCAGGGVFPLERSTFDIAEAIRPAVQACRPMMDARLQHFEIQLPPRPVRVNGDSLRLTQVFSNLLDNASKYTGADGAIALVLAVFDESLTVTVRDNGIGITPEALPSIFDLFVQETRALPLRNGGLGVGLAIARDLVEAHGGTIVGRSAGRDCGSEFVVKLPLADVHVASQVN
jgi:diguanylate cyclase (GGDEF)-like protein